MTCPDCGSRPDDPDIHQDGCERLGTCGQYGPPWTDHPFHPEDPPLATRTKGEPMAEWNNKTAVWGDALRRHRHDAHEMKGADVYPG